MNQPSPMTSLPSTTLPLALPYEILRRADGLVALSMNVGLIEFAPAWVTRVGADDLLIEGAASAASPPFMGLLRKVPSDVLASIDQNRSLRLYEFSAMGPFKAHVLSLRRSS